MADSDHSLIPDSSYKFVSKEGWMKKFVREKTPRRGVCDHCYAFGDLVSREACADSVVGDGKCCFVYVCSDGCTCTECGLDISGFRGRIVTLHTGTKAVCCECSRRYSHTTPMGVVWWGMSPNEWLAKYDHHPPFEGGDEK